MSQIDFLADSDPDEREKTKADYERASKEEDKRKTELDQWYRKHFDSRPQTGVPSLGLSGQRNDQVVGSQPPAELLRADPLCELPLSERQYRPDEFQLWYSHWFSTEGQVLIEAAVHLHLVNTKIRMMRNTFFGLQMRDFFPSLTDGFDAFIEAMETPRPFIYSIRSTKTTAVVFIF